MCLYLCVNLCYCTDYCSNVQISLNDARRASGASLTHVIADSDVCDDGVQTVRCAARGIKLYLVSLAWTLHPAYALEQNPQSSPHAQPRPSLGFTFTSLVSCLSLACAYTCMMYRINYRNTVVHSPYQASKTTRPHISRYRG